MSFRNHRNRSKHGETLATRSRATYQCDYRQHKAAHLPSWDQEKYQNVFVSLLNGVCRMTMIFCSEQDDWLGSYPVTFVYVTWNVNGKPLATGPSGPEQNLPLLAAARPFNVPLTVWYYLYDDSVLWPLICWVHVKRDRIKSFTSLQRASAVPTADSCSPPQSGSLNVPESTACCFRNLCYVFALCVSCNCPYDSHGLEFFQPRQVAD